MKLRNALETFSEEEQLARLHEMDAAECDALFDLVMLGVLSDGELSAGEAEVLLEEFSHLPFFGVAHSAEISAEHGFMQRGAILERIAAGETHQMLEDIAARIPTTEHRFAALRALALATEPGGIDDDELSVALEAAEVFGIDRKEAIDLLYKAWEFNHPPFLDE